VSALGQFLTRRPRAPKHGSDEQLAAAIATLPPDHPVNLPLPATVTTAEIRGLANAMHPQGPAAPSFTPTARDLANTRPFPAPVTARGTHARATPRHVQQDDGTLRRVRDRLLDLPDAPLSRADRFTADMRAPRKGGLPVFRQVAHKIGWCGLDEDPAPVMAPGQRSMAAWHEEARDAIDARFTEAQAEIRQFLAERDRRESRVRAAADAALALGYPGGTL